METAVLNLFSEIIKLGAAVSWRSFRLLGWVLVKKRMQRKADHERTTCLVSLPSDTSYEEILAFTRSLSGLPGLKWYKPAYAVALETYADAHGIKHYVSIPGHVIEGVEGWLETHIPGSSITHVSAKEDLVALTQWDRGTELSMSGANKQLLIKSPKDVTATILSGLSTMKPGNAVVLQWIVFRSEPQSPRVDNGIDPREHKEKVHDATFRATARIAAKGDEAKRLVRDVYAGLSITHTFGVKFRPRFMLGSVPDRVNRRAGVLDYRIFLNAPELSVVMGWPFDSMNVPGLGGARARRLAPHVSIPETGIGLAGSNYPKTRGRLIALPYASVPLHQWILGPTGTGKSALLDNEITQAMNQGLGVVLIEPKGDLARSVLSHVPRNRVDDVIWFDPMDLERPIGFNILAGPDPERTTAHLVTLFKDFYPDSWGPRLEWVLKYTFATAIANNLTLYDCKALLEDPEFRAPYVRRLKDIDTKRFWRKFDAGSDIVAASAINKLDAFAGTTIMRNIVGQTRGLDMHEVVSKNKILLIPLDGPAMGETNAAILGALFIDQLWLHARLRPEGERPPIMVVVDELQKFNHLSVSVGDMLAMARSYGVGFITAHQHTKQEGMSDSLVDDLKNNTHTKVAFALKPEDAKKLAEYFGPMSPADLGALALHEVAINTKTDEGSVTVTGKTFPPPMPTGAGPLAKRISRAAYGTPRADVKREIESRYPEPAERRRPKIGKVEDER